MKVLHVIETLAPSYGGPVSVLKQLAREQVRTGLDVEIFTTNADYPRGTLHAPGWHHLEGSAIPVFYGRVDLTALKVSFSFAREFRAALGRADVVHIHGLYRFPPSFAAYAARRAGKPHIIRPFGSLDPFLYSKSSRSVPLKRLYERLVDLPNLRQAGAIHFTATEEMRRASYLRFEGHQFVVPNAVDLGRYAVLPARGRLRERWGVGDSQVVLFLGRIHHKKGLDLLIPAFKRLLERRPATKLVIAGPENDSYGNEVRALVRQLGLDGSVHFCGELRGNDVVQAFVDADVFALTSYTENFGMAVVEAMCAGTPVLISDQVNISDDVRAEEAGVVVKCDIDEIAAGLTNILADRQFSQRLAERGRSMASARYSLPAVGNALTQEYTRLVQATKR